MLAFAHDRDREHWEVSVADRSKREGSRELQSLACLINYERTYDRFMEVQCSMRIDKRKRGLLSHAYEDSVLECAWPW